MKRSTNCKIKNANKDKREMKKLSIVIPAFNEKKLIIKILKKIKKIKMPNTYIELIIVDDGSDDGTKEILKKEGLKYADKVLYHEKNKGKGAALRTGFKETTGDVIIVQDADLEYDCMEIPNVVRPIFNDECDVCYGSRFLNNKYTGYKQNQYANKILTKLTNLITGFRISDMATCYKAFKGDIIRNIEIEENRFGFDPEITIKISKKKLRLKEVPIHYNYRTKEEGKKIRAKDGFRALYCIFKYKIIKSKKTKNSKNGFQNLQKV